MDELKTFHSLINDMWQLIKSSVNQTHTEDEWEEFLEQAKCITNDPKYASCQNMVISWILGYEKYLENKDGNT